MRRDQVGKLFTLFLLGAITVSLPSLLGCANIEQGPDPRPEVLLALGENVIIPRYAEFSSAMGDAVLAVEEFCSAPQEASLLEAQEAVELAYLGWKRSEVIAFGPSRDQPWALVSKLDIWPARPENVQELLDGVDPVDVEGLTFVMNGAKGLPAIQWLLWPTEVDSLTAFTDAQTGPRRCELLLGLTLDAQFWADLMVTAWAPTGENWLAELAAPPGPLERFPTSQDALAELVNRMVFTVENIRLLKLGKPIGFENAGTIQADRVESPYSGNSIAVCEANLQGMVDLFYGRYGDLDGPGIVDLLPESRMEELSSLFDEAVADGRAALAAVPAPLRDAIYEDRVLIEEAIETMRRLQIVLQVDVAQALSVTIRFNDTDGD